MLTHVHTIFNSSCDCCLMRSPASHIMSVCFAAFRQVYHKSPSPVFQLASFMTDNENAKLKDDDIGMIRYDAKLQLHLMCTIMLNTAFTLTKK